MIEADFSHYDEVFAYLHPEFKSTSKIDYWTGYYNNRPTLKQLIYKTFNLFQVTLTFINMFTLLEE